MKKLHKLVFVHYNIWLRARNLTCQCNTNDYYNPIDLNNIFNDDILDGWIREGEPILPPGDLGWLDEGIRRNDESGSDAVMMATMVEVNAVMITTMMEVVMMAVMAIMAIMMKGLVALVEANEVVLCHEIQIIMSHKI